MKKLKATALFGTLSLLGASAMVQAAPTLITTAQGRGADLNVRGGVFAAGNHGTNLLRVRNAADLGQARKMYLRFDLSFLPVPAKRATGVALGLQMLPAEGRSPEGKIWTFNVSGLRDALDGEKWDEKTVNWNNAPASDSASPSGLTRDATPLGTFLVTGRGTAGQQIAFSSPDFLKFLHSDTDGLVTLIVTRQEPGVGESEDVTHIFDSKENAKSTPPVLSVAFGGEAPILSRPRLPMKAVALAAEPVPANEAAAREINEFWEADKKQLPPKGAVLWMGSSSIKLWSTLARDFSEVPVINRGFGGSLIQDSTRYADRIAVLYQPKLIVLAAGTNDLAYGGKNPAQVFQDFKDFEAKIHESLPDTRLVYISINPTLARWNQESEILESNYLIEKFIFENGSNARKMNFINSHAQLLTADGQPQRALLGDDLLHLNSEGYKVWTSILKPRILALAALDGVERLDAPKLDAPKDARTTR